MIAVTLLVSPQPTFICSRVPALLRVTAPKVSIAS
eukprot:COSAG03_NODE_11_length_23018_cov_29.686461_8_plen_35_part_00